MIQRCSLLLAAGMLLVVLLVTPGLAERKLHPNEIRSPNATPTQVWSQPPAGAKPARGGTAILSLLQDIDSLNPFTSSSVSASEIQDLIFPRLYVEEADYYNGPPTFTPNIAAGPPVPGDDGLSLTITLRECYWSDGKPITGKDVRFSWQAGKNKDVAWVSRSIVDPITDVEVDPQDPRKFTVRYAKKYPYQQMDINDVQIIPMHSFGTVPFNKWQTHGQWLEQAKVAGGPWMLGGYKPNEEITLVRNPKYWVKDQPYLEKAVFRIFGDMRPLMTALLAGDIDFMNSVTPKDVKRVLEAGHLRLYTYLSRVFGYIGWNCRKWPFDDHRVRQAMSHAIDRENIVDSIFYGYAKVAGPNIISSMWASKKDLEPYEYDPDRAEELLQEAGWKKNSEGIYEKDGKPFKFTLVTNAGNPPRKQICEYTQANLREIGVQCDIELKDFNLMSTQLKKHAYQAWCAAWSIATKVDMKPTWHSSSTNKGYNYCDYRNQRIDEIIENARYMADFKKALPLWHEFQDILYKDQPYTMVYEPRGLVAVNKKFVNVKVNALRYLANLHEWWIAK